MVFIYTNCYVNYTGVSASNKMVYKYRHFYFCLKNIHRSNYLFIYQHKMNFENKMRENNIKFHNNIKNKLIQVPSYLTILIANIQTKDTTKMPTAKKIP